ncbi:hypothetical protein [Pedobacter duraquae]|uniref:Uncharacterized protein n=1 Tax=Pedobacter duraquae TaxID=425511 RepID=A0A4R6IGI2_9SPHI|nr:hypothetical protein [Pedobacter duraquae]TDO20946.1 hypothetical protein CLV32_3583 [Pedobacter duraquae]
MKIELNSNEIIALDDFELGWRWDNLHNPGILTEDKIQLKPLSIIESKSLYKIVNFFESEINLSNGFQPNSWVRASSETKESIDKFSNYFRELTRNYDENIFISWSRSTCLYTTKDIFIKYWDDFCYPSSDDITIISELTNWVYFYNHIEVGQFWIRK